MRGNTNEMTHRVITREYPWHLRLPNAQHYQWFKNLVELHELASLWLKEVQVDRPSHLLSRGLNSEVTENLWMLDSLANTQLDQFLDDSTPDDILSRLEKPIWALQAWTLSHMMSQTKVDNRPMIESLLEQVSWKAGKACAEKRWSTLVKAGNQDLGAVLLALHDSPFSGYPNQDGYLVRRSTRSEVQIELRSCPHQVSFPEVKEVADSMCRFHSHWVRGFGYALNQRVSMEHVIRSPRCFQRWFFG